MRLGILISGRGSNFEAISNSIASRRLDAEIAIVISNRANAPGLEIARERGIPLRVWVVRDENENTPLEPGPMASDPGNLRAVNASNLAAELLRP